MTIQQEIQKELDRRLEEQKIGGIPESWDREIALLRLILTAIGQRNAYMNCGLYRGNIPDCDKSLLSIWKQRKRPKKKIKFKKMNPKDLIPPEDVFHIREEKVDKKTLDMIKGFAKGKKSGVKEHPDAKEFDRLTKKFAPKVAAMRRQGERKFSDGFFNKTFTR